MTVELDLTEAKNDKFFSLGSLLSSFWLVSWPPVFSSQNKIKIRETTVKAIANWNGPISPRAS